MDKLCISNTHPLDVRAKTPPDDSSGPANVKICSHQLYVVEEDFGYVFETGQISNLVLPTDSHVLTPPLKVRCPSELWV